MLACGSQHAFLRNHRKRKYSIQSSPVLHLAAPSHGPLLHCYVGQPGVGKVGCACGAAMEANEGDHGAVPKLMVVAMPRRCSCPEISSCSCSEVFPPLSPLGPPCLCVREAEQTSRHHFHQKREAQGRIDLSQDRSTDWDRAQAALH